MSAIFFFLEREETKNLMTQSNDKKQSFASEYMPDLLSYDTLAVSLCILLLEAA